MNVHKNMEVIFVAVLTAFGAGSVLVDYLPSAEAGAKAPVVVERNIATPTSMAVVVVRAPR